MSEPTLTPEVSWAQRSSTADPERNYIYLTVGAPDVSKESAKIDLKPTSLTFTGHSETKNVTYHVELNFYDEIDVENSKTNHTARDLEFVLRKKGLKEEYWPRLLKDSKKMHFLKTNFDKWVDEDEQDAAPEDDLGAGMGGMPDMGAMGGMGGDGGFGGIDFSKLGGGAGGAMPEMGDMPEDSDDEGGAGDDDEMPGLEGDDATKEAEGAAKAAETVEGMGEGKGKGKVEDIPGVPQSGGAKIEEVP